MIFYSTSFLAQRQRKLFYIYLVGLKPTEEGKSRIQVKGWSVA